jgi:hypothetical protein
MLFASFGGPVTRIRSGVMRITGGVFGGRLLVAPRDISVRPTSDRTRQAIFNILRHKDFGIGFALEGAAVLDLFAGTGALGIEALPMARAGASWWTMRLTAAPCSGRISRR